VLHLVVDQLLVAVEATAWQSFFGY
jgi:hypothetical protein